uniref:Kinesin motor domain-containing protein n=1 Tax=Plectus sambesii TaxID=2011161 RepID=A0A914VJC9_9BILA
MYQNLRRPEDRKSAPSSSPTTDDVTPTKRKELRQLMATPQSTGVLLLGTAAGHTGKNRAIKRRKTELDCTPFRPNKGSTTIQVALRIRPFGDRELRAEENESKIISISKDKKTANVLAHAQQKSISFDFAAIFDASASQEEVYSEIGKPHVNALLDGYNCCILAYGQTGSGKTFSVSGTNDQPGILPRFCHDLFSVIDEEISAGSAFLEMSFFEIYQDKIYDLLVDKGERNALRVRGGDQQTGAYVEGLMRCTVQSISELEKHRKAGVKRRATAATAMNDRSSRSHALVLLRLTRVVDEVVGDEQKSFKRTGTAYIVDLAGSERSQADSENERFQETVAINSSLSVLHRVIFSKVSSVGNFASYRDSPLTFLLKDCLGGNSRTTLLATVSPCVAQRAETVSTMRFASQAAAVTLRPTVNEDPMIATIRELRAENERLRQQMEGRPPNANTPDVVITPAEPEPNDSNFLADDDDGRRLVDQDRPQPPSLLQLSPDSALSIWTPLTSPTSLNVMNKEGAARIVSSDSNSWQLEALADDVVFLNGTLMVANETRLLSHGDRIVLSGLVFLLVWLQDDDSLLKKQLYESAKLEYMEAWFPILSNRMEKEAGERLEKEKKDLELELTNQIASQKAEQERIEEQLKQLTSAQIHNVIEHKAKLERLQRERDEALNAVRDAEEFRQRMESTLSEQRAQLDVASRNNRRKSKRRSLIDLESAVHTANNILQQIGKDRATTFWLMPHSVGENDDDPINYVVRQQQNSKHGMSADLTAEQFMKRYNRLVELYTNPVSTNESDYETLLFDNRLPWRSKTAGRLSNLFTTAICNAMKQTAKARGSSIGQLRRSLIGGPTNDARRSSLSRFFTSLKEEDETEEIGEMISFSEQQCHSWARSTLPDSKRFGNAQSRPKLLFDSIVELLGLVDNLRAVEKQTLHGLPKVSVLAASSRAVGRLDVLVTPVMLVRPGDDECLEIVALRIRRRAQILRDEMERWMESLDEKAIYPPTALPRITNAGSKLLELIGHFAFWANEPMTVDSPENAASETAHITLYARGVFFALRHAVEEDLRAYYERLKRAPSTPTVDVLLSMYDLLKELCNHVSTDHSDDVTIFRLARPLLAAFKHAMSNSNRTTNLLGSLSKMTESIESLSTSAKAMCKMYNVMLPWLSDMLRQLNEAHDRQLITPTLSMTASTVSPLRSECSRQPCRTLQTSESSFCDID